MKYSSLILLFLFIISVSCNDNIIDTENVNTPVLKVEFRNDSLIYNLEGYYLPIEFSVTNTSEKSVLIQAKDFGDGQLFIAQKDQHFRNGEWNTDSEIESDTNISLAPQSTINSLLWARFKGEWRTLIPTENQDTFYTPTVTIINQIENYVDFSIYQITDSQKVHVTIKNNSDQKLKLGFAHYGYCHFSYLSYDLVEDRQYKELFWDDNNLVWKLTRTPVYAICYAEPPEIFIQPGEEYQETLNVVLPTGVIVANFRFYVGDEQLHLKRISRTFEYK